MEDIIAQLSAALVPLLGAVCGYLAGKLRAAAKRAKEKDAADQKQQAALADGVKSLLRGQIIDDGLPGVPSSYHLVVGFETSQDGNQDINIFTGAQRMGGQWYAKAYNYGDTIQGKLTWVAFP